MNCPHREEHLNQEKIKLLGNKLYFMHNNTAVPRGNSEKSCRQIIEDTCRHISVMQNNMFAEPGEVYKQESVPGILGFLIVAMEMNFRCLQTRYAIHETMLFSI